MATPYLFLLLPYPGSRILDLHSFHIPCSDNDLDCNMSDTQFISFFFSFGSKRVGVGMYNHAIVRGIQRQDLSVGVGTCIANHTTVSGTQSLGLIVVIDLYNLQGGGGSAHKFLRSSTLTHKFFLEVTCIALHPFEGD